METENLIRSDTNLGIKRFSHAPEYYAAFAANLGAFAFGTMMSWSATALPDIRNDPSIGNLTLHEESFVASTVTLGALVSGPASGYCVDFFGRRNSMLMLTTPFVTGWLLIYFAVDVYMIYVGRFLTGEENSIRAGIIVTYKLLGELKRFDAAQLEFAEHCAPFRACGTALTIVAPLYVSEISSPDIRGFLAAGFEVMTNFGILYTFILGAFLSWRSQALVCALVPVIFHVLMYCVPASPRYLLGKGRREEALVALKWFRTNNSIKEIEAELNELEEDMQRCSTEATPTTLKEAWRAMSSRNNIRPVLIILGLFVVESFSGEDPMLFYMVDIFNNAGTSLDSYTCAIIVAVVQIVASMGAALVVDRSGRRVLLLTSLLFMAIALGSLALYFYLKLDNISVATDLNWLPLASVTLFIISDNIGLGPMIYLIMGEILPHSVRGVASSILMSFKWLLAFLVVQNFENILVTIGDAQGLSLFAIFCLLGLLFIFLYVPETKGKSLEEIQSELKPKSRSSQVSTSLSPPILGKYGAINT